MGEKSGAVSDNGLGRMFRGVGTFRAAAKPLVLRQGADDEAHAAVARAISDYLDVLTVQFNLAPSSSPDASPPLGDDAISALRSAAVSVMKKTAKISSRWRGPGEADSLCVLKFVDFKKGVAAAPSLAAGTTSFLEMNADKAFDALLK
ncbi:MAG: hypothetical protein ACYCPQ_05990 [Elusimicrobiota bacterium]